MYVNSVENFQLGQTSLKCFTCESRVVWWEVKWKLWTAQIQFPLEKSAGAHQNEVIVSSFTIEKYPLKLLLNVNWGLNSNRWLVVGYFLSEPNTPQIWHVVRKVTSPIFSEKIPDFVFSLSLFICFFFWVFLSFYFLF